MTLHLAVLQHEPETTLGAFAPLLDHVELRLVRTGGELPDLEAFDGAIVLGGSLSAYDATLLETRRWIRDAVLTGRPVLGVCLGAQLLATALGGIVGPSPQPEVGVHDVFLTEAGTRDPLFAGLPHRFSVLGWHEDAFTLPRRAVPLAGSLGCAYQAFRYDVATYGLQFHPEVRVDDLSRWRGTSGYADMLERVGRDWDELEAEVAGASGEFDVLARRLVERWLSLVQGVRSLSERRVVGF
jgi:GMP synthase-like glutamine amidotransferase